MKTTQWQEFLRKEYTDPNGNISVKADVLEHLIESTLKQMIDSIPDYALSNKKVKRDLQNTWLS